MDIKPLQPNKAELNILKKILEQISIENFTKKIGGQIDKARISYWTDQIVIEFFEELSFTILTFYVHTLKQLNRLSIPVNFEVLEAEAFELLRQAFSDKGGIKSAIAESRTGVHGGVRYILDQMADQLKSNEFAKAVNMSIKSSFDLLEYGIRVELIKDLIEILKPNLPPEIYTQPPERFANHYEILIKSYIRSLDQIRNKFQAF